MGILISVFLRYFSLDFASRGAAAERRRFTAEGWESPVARIGEIRGGIGMECASPPPGMTSDRTQTTGL